MAWTRRLPSGKFQGQYRDANDQVKSAGVFPRENQALGKAASAEDDARLHPKTVELMTWSQWEPRWQARRAPAPQSLKGDLSKIKHHVRPKWGDVPLTAITTGEIQEWVLALRKGGSVRTTASFEAGRPLAASTVMKCYRILSSSMKAAVGAGLVDRSPCVGIKIPRDGNSPERYLSGPEQDAIVDELEGLDALLVRLGFSTGLRLGELLGLHWESIDLDAKSIHVRHAYDPEDVSMKPPKTWAIRAVPLADEVIEFLEARIAETGPGMQCPVRHNGSTKCRTGLVFAGVRGEPIDSDNFRHRRWERACRRASTPDGHGRDIPVGHVRIHDMRHTFASVLVRAGIPLAEVCTLMGHSSIVVTMRYAHLGTSQWGAVSDVLNGRAANRAAKPQLKIVTDHQPSSSRNLG